MTLEMSKDCKYFVQHAWKQDLCANCFELREDHWKKLKQLNVFVPTITANVRSILGPRENSQKQRKNVAFRSSLTEIIGYGGDDEIYESFECNSNDSNENGITTHNNDDYHQNYNLNNDDENIETAERIISSECNISSSYEEDRVLSNLTRSNTNFNRIAANFIESSISSGGTEKIIPKCFDNLILGNIQKDSEGKKKTLFVSVTPFGANTNFDVISAGRSADRSSIDDERKRVIAMPANVISNIESNHISPVSKHQSTKLNDTLENKCQKVNQLTVEMNLNYSEYINNDLSLSKMKNNDINIENVLAVELPVSASVSSVSPNVEHSGMSNETANQIESIDNVKNYESTQSEIQENHEIDDIKLNEENMCLNTSSNLSSTDSTTINTSAVLSIILPKPRNSFLHGGKNIDDFENSLPKLNETNEIVDLSFSTSPKNNVSNNEIQEERGPKLSEKSSDDSSNSIFTRKPASSLKSDCPVVREKEKRERATSCSPKFRNMNENSFTLNYHDELPDTMSKRCASRSLSRHSSSSYSAILSNTNVDDETKKKNKTRFSLKRLLRIGSSKKDLNITTEDTFAESIKNISSVSQFKNKPEIIHPLELDGAAVEIVYHDKLLKITDEITNIRSSNSRAVMREPPPPPPTNMQLSSQSESHQLSPNKSVGRSLHDEQERTKISTHDTDREHPSCHSITSTSSTSTVHSMSADSIHTGIHNFGKFRPIQCN